MKDEDYRYLIQLLELRAMDVDEQARKQASAGYSMASVERILEEKKYIRELTEKLNAAKIAAFNAS